MVVGCFVLYLLGRSTLGGIVYEVSIFPVRALVGGGVFLVAKAGNSVRGAGSYRKRLEQLEKENAQLRLKVAELQEAAQESGALRSLLRAREEVKGGVVFCRVVARSPSYWFHTLTINIGSKDGVNDRTVLIDGKGVVGRVYRANYFTSNVLILSGRQEGLFSGIGAKVERTRDMGVVEGDNGPELRLAYLQPDAEIRQGDIVLTSGIGGVFPAGLPIGTVRAVAVSQDGLSKSAAVVPSADLSHLDFLLALLPAEGGRG
jgi:rod shape-determining protein MreC